MIQSNEASNNARLVVPVEARYARVVRMTAANMATIAGLAVDDVDDVRMAAEEAFVYACATGLEDCISIEFQITGQGLAMDFELGPLTVSENDRESALVYSAFILEAVCDECVITDGEHSSMHLFKGKESSDALR